MNNNSTNSVEDKIPETTKILLGSVNETARITRTALLLFLVVALYLLIIVGTTTDLMLLRGEIVALPLMEVGVPVVAFYIAAPLIFLLLHINLLLRLSQLTETVRQWKENIQCEANRQELKDECSIDYNTLVFPLDFAQLLVKGKSRFVLWPVVVIQIALLPIVVLLVLQMSFLAYQNSDITSWHQIIVTIDLGSLLLFAFSVRGALAERKIDRNDVLKMLFQMPRNIAAVGIVLIFTWTIAVVPNSWQETMGLLIAMLAVLFFPLRSYVVKRLRNKQDNELNHFFPPTKSILLYGLIVFSFFGAVAIAIDSLQERFIQQQLSAYVFADWWEGYPLTTYRPFRRYLKVVEQPIALKEAPPEIVGALIRQIGEHSPDIPCQHIGELDLRQRELNYALFYKSQFYCVKLEEAKLHGADLSEAELHGVALRGAELHGADLFDAELYGADLFDAELHGAYLQWTELHGANLQYAELHGSDLSFAKLHATNLLSAKLHGADLGFAELYAADLLGAELHGADLGEAILKNTNLSAIYWGKPEDWNTIKGNISKALRKQELTDDEIKKKLLRIEANAATDFGFIPPTTPSKDDCVFHNGEGPFEGWSPPATECDSEFISSVVEVACHDQWTAKGIVNRAIFERETFDKDVNLINTLHGRHCLALQPYRRKLSDILKKLNE